MKASVFTTGMICDYVNEQAELAKAESLTPAQNAMMGLFEKYGYEIEYYDENGVRKIWAKEGPEYEVDLSKPSSDF